MKSQEELTRASCILGPRKRVALGLIISTFFISFNILQSIERTRLLSQSVDAEEENLYAANENYLIWSEKCKIPNVDPFHESIRKFLHKTNPLVCSKKPPLTYTFVITEETSQYFLKMNISALSHYSSNPDNVSCCYSVVTRFTIPDGEEYNKSADALYNVSKCVSFKDVVMLKPEEEFFLVRCYNHIMNDTKEVYSNVHVVVPIKETIKSKLDKSQEIRAEQQRLNVIILGFDSISRLNMLRSMPKTIKHLHNTGWIELLGYNKVGDNTLPNVAAILMGLDLVQVQKRCWESPYKKLDDCPFLWNEFSKQGYVTAYLEDVPHLSTFNFHRTGFVKPPTDYYFRPIMLAAEKNIEVKKRDGMNACLGSTMVTDIILGYMRNFTTVFNKALYFMWVWINNFSHNNISTPGTMDDNIFNFFQDLEKTGALNTSLVIFLSDHGMRWGSLRETSIGWLEERLPFIYIWIPEWFKIKYPGRYKNLKLNSNRLTSPYDIHMTLRDALNMSELSKNSEFSEGCLGCPKCVSLLSEVPANRACDEAGITDNWCTCTNYRDEPIEDEIVGNISIAVLSEINTMLKNGTNNSNVCAELRLDHVINIKHQEKDKPLGDKAKSEDVYVIMFDTLPGGAVFEATVGHSSNISNNSASFHLKGTVSRLNTYGNQSECVDDSELKLYCYCK